jgi:hypothetical protein
MAGRLTTEDFLAIQEVMARYNWAFDAGDGDTWAKLWTADGELKSAAVATGHAALAEACKGSFKMLHGATRHHMTDLFGEYGTDKSTINAKGCNLVTDWHQGGKMFGLALSDLVFSKVGGEWKLKSNHITLKKA